jgi:hypothetical protein
MLGCLLCCQDNFSGIDEHLGKHPVSDNQYDNQNPRQVMTPREEIEDPVKRNHHHSNYDEIIVLEFFTNPTFALHVKQDTPLSKVKGFMTISLRIQDGTYPTIIHWCDFLS